MTAPLPEEFIPLLHDSQNSFGEIIRIFPKSDFSRSPASQLGVGVVGALIAIGFLVISRAVVVSNVPEEQLPFQQAMWGIAAVGGILSLYGFGTGVSRLMNGLTRVGRWWLLCERGVVIFNQGVVERSCALESLRVLSGTKCFVRRRA